MRTPSISGNTYSVSVPLTGMDYQQSYTIDVVVSDKLDSVSKSVTLGKGLPMFAFGQDWFKFFVSVTFEDWLAGIYIKRKGVSGSAELAFQSDLMPMDGTGYSRQTVFIFGSDNHTPFHGMLTIASNGTCAWSGTGDISATVSSTGYVTIALPRAEYDQFVLISGRKIS